VDSWLPLVIALLGLTSTLLGVWMTQRVADCRDEKRQQHERQAEQERRLREDATRTFDHRRDAYLAFVEEWWRFSDAIFQAKMFHDLDPSTPHEPDHDYLDPLRNRLLAIRIYGTGQAKSKADAAFEDMRDRAFEDAGLRVGAIDDLIEQIRADLGVLTRDVG